MFGSIFPDSDYLFDWILGTQLHRAFSHSLLTAAIGFLAVFLGGKLLNKKFKNVRPFAYGLAFGFGILTHLVADMIMGFPGVALFWPLKIRFWLLGMGAENFITTPLMERSKEKLITMVRFAIFDMGLGVIWIGYLFFKKKIRKF